MLEIAVYFFAALGVCLSLLEIYKISCPKRLHVWLTDDEDVIKNASQADVIIVNNSEEGKILSALSEKYDKISIQIKWC